MTTYSYKQLKSSEQEKVRIQACEDVRLNKLSRNQVVKKYNISLPALKKWLSKYDKGGISSLKEQKQGRPCGSGMRLSDKQMKELANTIETETPEQSKLQYLLWSRESIKVLIKKKFKVDYSKSHMSYLMDMLGFTVQKPQVKYGQQDPKKVEKWLNEEYPALVKRVKKEKGEIHWADETGVQNRPNSERSYAPRGKTPIIKKSGKRLKKSLISSVSNQGKLRFMVYDGGLTGKKMIEFMRRLTKSVNKKVFLVVDNLRTHKSEEVKRWVKAHSERIELIYLPEYSPELNPTELVNSHLKKIVFKERYPESEEELGKQVGRGMKKIQSKEEKVKALFEHPSVSYARAA